MRKLWPMSRVYLECMLELALAYGDFIGLHGWPVVIYNIAILKGRI